MSPAHRESWQVLDASRPQLARLYHHLMRTAGILTPPKIEVLRLPSIGMADYVSDTIALDSHYVDHAPPRHTRVVIGHETGHILAEHRCSSYTPLNTLKAQEHEADRLSVYLSGSHDDASETRHWSNEATRHGWNSKLQSGYDAGYWDKLAHRLEQLKPSTRKRTERVWANYVRVFGTPEELEANIRSVDLNDRGHFEALVARRNERTETERG